MRSTSLYLNWSMSECAAWQQEGYVGKLGGHCARPTHPWMREGGAARGSWRHRRLLPPDQPAAAAAGWDPIPVRLGRTVQGDDLLPGQSGGWRVARPHCCLAAGPGREVLPRRPAAAARAQDAVAA